jgi:hypothetical protein
MRRSTCRQWGNESKVHICRLTCEDGGFKKLHKLVDLDEHIDGHFEVSADTVSSRLAVERYNAYKI